jgi:aminopeptidase N
MKLRILIPSAVLITLMACHTNKKATNTATTANTAPKAVNADTVKTSNEDLKEEVYRASNPRLNDILHTRLDVSFDWTHSQLIGTATIDLKQQFYPSDMLYLNARGMDIKSLKVYNLNVPITDKSGALVKDAKENPVEMSSSYKYENDSLKINLGKVFTNNEKYRVVIEYISKPNELKRGGSMAISDDKGLYFINPQGENLYKMPQIWTQGETQSNSAWFPTIDSPNEKMTQEIFMTVEDKFTTLSNGLLVDSKKNPDGTRVDHWKLDLQHAPYLAMMAVGQFKKVVDEPWNGREVSYYVEKEYEPHAKGIFGDTKEMIEFYSTRLGVPYAWPKYAQIAVRDYVSGAMENTSATLHGDFVVYQTTREMIDGKKGQDVIAHELFHQWFGDLATCESWSNLPLNESFATYGEYLWEEYKHGRDAADHHHMASRAGYMASKHEVNLIRFNYENREDMFDAFSYNKGGQVLHMLRKAVGDDAFFASLKNYLETNKFKAAEIHNLRLAFEEVTGTDMNWFFNQWFLRKGRPDLKVRQTYKDGAVELTVEQNQDLKKYPLYRLPLEVDVYCNGKASRTHITITDQKQAFKLKADCQPQLVNFDAERQLLCDLDYDKTTDEYIFQYKNAPLYQDRNEALDKLEDKLSEQSVYELFKWAAENDKYMPIRNYCIFKLEKAPAEKMAEVKALYLKIFANDQKTRVKARALASLNKKFSKDADVVALNEKALADPSYAVNGEALQFFTTSNPKFAMEKAKQLEGEIGTDIMFPISALYAEHGSDEQIAYFQGTLKYMTGFSLATYIGNYSKTARRCNTPGAAIAAAMDLESMAKSATRFTRFPCVKGLKDLTAVWEGKEKAMKAKVDEAKAGGKDASAMEKELKTITETKDIIAKKYNGVK